MALVLNEDQEMLRDAARGFLRRRSPVSELRRVRDEQVEGGFSRDIWREMAEQGFAGAASPPAKPRAKPHPQPTGWAASSIQ